MSNLEMSNSQNVLTALAASVCDVTIIGPQCYNNRTTRYIVKKQQLHIFTLYTKEGVESLRIFSPGQKTKPLKSEWSTV